MPTVADATATVQFDHALTADATRTAWRAAVADVAAKAQAALPQCNGRIAKAAALVLASVQEGRCRGGPALGRSLTQSPRQ